jgi:C-terminal processing protease CtpA/Prc
MSICGGTNKSEGPGIYIDSVIKGGDVHRQGIMQPGDELVSVNGHLLQGLTHERAMKILTRLKLRQVKQVRGTWFKVPFYIIIVENFTRNRINLTKII